MNRKGKEMTESPCMKIRRQIYIDTETAKWLSDLGQRGGSLNGNLSAGVRIAAKFTRDHMKESGSK